MGQNKVAYQKSASWVIWKCLKSSCVVLVVVVGWGGVVASYPLLSQAPTPVEVELGCDNNQNLWESKKESMNKAACWIEIDQVPSIQFMFR